MVPNITIGTQTDVMMRPAMWPIWVGSVTDSTITRVATLTIMKKTSTNAGATANLKTLLFWTTLTLLGRQRRKQLTQTMRNTKSA